jgi:hypothetical protein
VNVRINPALCEGLKFRLIISLWSDRDIACASQRSIKSNLHGLQLRRDEGTGAVDCSPRFAPQTAGSKRIELSCGGSYKNSAQTRISITASTHFPNL